MAATTERTDLAVAGAGPAGLFTAIEGLQQGLDVIVFEKGARAGGSMYLSGGAIYSFPSVEKVHEAVPHGRGDLQELVVTMLEENINWLDDMGITLKEPEYQSHFGGEETMEKKVLPESRAEIEEVLERYKLGTRVDPPEFTDELVGIVNDLGGEVRLRTPFEELQTDESGAITGLVARNSDGEKLNIEADAVVLATGGFQGNEELIEKYITENTDNLWLRSNPWSTGDGLLAAKDVGAKTSSGMSNFYGHTMAAPPAEFKPVEFHEVTQFYGPWALALNKQGERFADESESPIEETLTQDVAKMANGRAYYVVDEDLYDSLVHLGHVGTIIEKTIDAGARGTKAESLEELGRDLSEWGVNGERAVETIREYNSAIRNDSADSLEPSREGNRLTFDTPPFYAVEVQAAITFTMGGLSVNQNMQVHRRNNSSSSLLKYPDSYEHVFEDAIEGLYAAGMDVGNIHRRKYIGGISTCLATGRTAARHAAQYIES